MKGIRSWLRRLFGGETGPAPVAEEASEEPVPVPEAEIDFARLFVAARRARRPEPLQDDGCEFALALYGQLRQAGGNLFFSPFSLRTALTLAYAGAKGDTAAQMSEVLGLPPSGEPMHAAINAAIEWLGSAGGNGYELDIANSLWCQEGLPLLAEFQELVSRQCRDCINRVDFRGAAEAARVTINRWVEDWTRRRIQGLIPPGGVGADTRLVLVNAVYFKGLWEQPFDEADTSDGFFHLEGGGKVIVPMMRRQAHVEYMNAGDYQAVDLAYQGDDLSMLVLLPKRNDGLRDLENGLSVGMLRECALKLVPIVVKLHLPRFEMTWGSIDVAAQLKALGMADAFTRFEADFSGINGLEPAHEESLYLSSIFHKAFIGVGERGTEAAAASAGYCLKAMELPTVPVFLADHPFVFAIRDRKRGAILFLGRVADLSPASTVH